MTCDESSLGPYDVAARFGAALDTLGVAYYLGGSLASSIHGEPRSTNDVDQAARARALHAHEGLGPV